VIMNGVHVGEGALIEGSILMDGVRIGSRARVTGCSVIGEGQHVEADARVHDGRVPAPK